MSELSDRDKVVIMALFNEDRQPLVSQPVRRAPTLKTVRKDGRIFWHVRSGEDHAALVGEWEKHLRSVRAEMSRM